jgi:hAT family C-terminal dimerisation region
LVIGRTPEPDQQPELQPQASSSTNSNYEERDRKLLHDFFVQKQLKPVAPSLKSPHQIIDNFKMDQCHFEVNVVEYWEKKRYTHPEMYGLSQLAFAVPPTQVSVERAFSALRLILTYLRYNLAPQLLEDLLLVKLNFDLID